MARTNVFTTAKRIRRQVGNGHREENGVLFATIDDAQTSLQFKTTMPSSVHEGVTLCIDLELILVITADPATNICTILRGFEDSEPAAHLAESLIEIGPRFTLLDIVDAMVAEVDSWGQDLYWTDTRVFDVSTSLTTLELPIEWTELTRILSCVQQETDTSESVWPRVRHKLIRGNSGVTNSAAPTSGVLVRFTEAIRTGRVQITAGIPFDTDLFTEANDLVTNCHLTKSMIDVLEMGSRIRLISNSDDEATGRNAQDEPRRAAETPIGSMVSLSQLRLARYTRRLADEKARLNRLYPTRMS